MVNSAQQLHGVGQVQLEVLRGNDIHSAQSGFGVGAYDNQALVGKGSRGDLGTRGPFHMFFNSSFDSIGIFGAKGYQIATSQRVMLGLCHEIDGNQFRQSGFVGNHAYLGGACDHVDSHITGNKLLCGGNESIARAGDLIYRLDALGSVCQRADSLGAAYSIDFGYTGQRGTLPEWQNRANRLSWAGLRTQCASRLQRKRE